MLSMCIKSVTPKILWRFFITTKNWDATAAATLPTSADKPYGDKGVVVFRRGGDGAIVQNRFLTNSNSVPIVSNQPGPLQ